MTKNEFYFSSANEKAGMRAVEWVPEGEPKAVLYLLHDVAEQVHCYEALTEFFTAQGFVVVDGACQNQGCLPYGTEEMHTCLSVMKRKYPDVPYLLMGLAKGAPAVHSFVNTYPGAVEGIVLADAEQGPQTMNKDLPVLQLSGVEENHQEAFRYIYRWTEERLDEMLYRAATKH